MNIYDVLIKFVDGTEKIITNADDFCSNKDTGCFLISKNGYRIFVPMERTLYVGRKFDLEE